MHKPTDSFDLIRGLAVGFVIAYLLLGSLVRGPSVGVSFNYHNSGGIHEWFRELDYSGLGNSLRSERYRDAKGKDDPEDQFLSWVNLPGSGLTNAGGIRALKSPNPSRKEQIDGVFLFTHSGKTNTPKPWDDIVDQHNGVIYYWGDSVADPDKSLDDFKGNKVLKALDENLRNGSTQPSFILHLTTN